MTVTQLAAALDLDVHDAGICLPCLSFVAFPLDAGDEPETVRAVSEFAPILWDEGLAPPLEAALERAKRRELPGAAMAIDDVELHGSGALIVAAVVRRLAADLTRRTREDLRRQGLLDLPEHVLEFLIDRTELRCNTL